MIRKEKLDKFAVNENISFGEAIAKYDAGGETFLAVVDNNNVLRGIVTEGDLRKAILRGISRDEKVPAVMNAHPFVLNKRLTDSEMIHIMNTAYHYRIKQIPIVDGLNTLQDIVFRNEIVRKTGLENKAIIMAGGEGSRLGLLTNDTPKPLLEVGGRPLLEITVERLRDSGINEIYISVSYLARKIKGHFGNGEKYGVSIKYIEEKAKLGTAGSLLLIKDIPKAPFIVLNGDVMTTLSFEALLEYHEKEQNDITVTVKEYNFTVPFGVAKISANYLIDGIDEKPTKNYFIISGIYVLNPHILSLIDSVRYLDMTDLITQATEARYRVGGFPIREYWLDIGNGEDFQNANRDYVKVFSEENDH